MHAQTDGLQSHACEVTQVVIMACDCRLMVCVCMWWGLIVMMHVVVMACDCRMGAGGGGGGEAVHACDHGMCYTGNKAF